MRLLDVSAKLVRPNVVDASKKWKNGNYYRVRGDDRFNILPFGVEKYSSNFLLEKLF